MNCRIDGLDKYKPDLIIIDRNLKLKRNLKLLRLSKKRKIYIVTISKNKKKLSFFTNKKIKIINIKKLKNKKDFEILFNKLFLAGNGRILIESGLVFLIELLKIKFIDNLYLFKSNEILGKKGSNNANVSFIRKLKLTNRIKVNLNKNKLYRLKLNNV